MSPQDIERFARQMELVEKLLGVAKLILGAIGACAAGLVAVAMWVNNTNTAIAQTKADIMKERQEIQLMVDDRKDTLKEWSKWRSDKDKTDVELTQLAINQAKATDRIYALLDRMDTKLSKE